MGRGSLHIGLLIHGCALVGGCSSELVSLGYNVEAGIAAQAGPQNTTPGLGASTASTPPGASDAASGLCLQNPTFLGVPTTPPGIARRTSPNLPDWAVCGGNVDVNPGICTLSAPPMTTTYLGLPVGYAAFQYAIATSVSTPLQAALPAGNYPFSIELGVAVSTLPRGGFGIAGGAPVELVIYGSLSPCGRDQLLARMWITNTDSWTGYSSVLTASHSFSNIVLVPTLSTSDSPGRAGAYVIVGNFVSPSCN